MRITDSPPAAATDAALLDRLVDGELPEADRDALLRRLDGEPDGWKRCALAFLEAQAWRQAFAADAAAARAQPPNPPAGRRIVPRRWAAVAAAVLVAFLTGTMVHRSSRQAGDGPGGGRTLAQQSDAPAPPNAIAAAPTAPPPHSVVPEYLRRQMERQGYRVDGQRKVVPVALDDGRRVALPVETLSLRYVGQRIH